MKSQFNLLKTRRFLPLFVVQFFGAFNDNAFKLAMLTLISYHLTTEQSVSEHYQALAAGCFTLPFFLFSATAGQLADKYDKATITIWVKVFEVCLMCVGGWALYQGNISVMLVTLFGMGVHSSFFGPVKYAILPNHLHKNELLAGNGLIEASTFVAILLGTLLGTLAIGAQKSQVGLAVGMILLCASFGLLASFFVPSARTNNVNLRVELNLVKATWHIICQARQHQYLFLIILTVSWFWFVGAVILTKLPDFTHYEMTANTSVFAVFLALFSIGIATGSLTINSVLKGQVNARMVPVGMMGISIFATDIYFATQGMTISKHLLTVGEFFSQFSHWRVAIDFFLLAVCGGFFIVPLYAMLQLQSDDSMRSRVIAANNIINALFMVISAVFVGVMARLGFSIAEVFLILAAMNVLVGTWLCHLVGWLTIKKNLAKYCFIGRGHEE